MVRMRAARAYHARIAYTEAGMKSWLIGEVAGIILGLLTKTLTPYITNENEDNITYQILSSYFVSNSPLQRSTEHLIREGIVGLINPAFHPLMRRPYGWARPSK